MAAAATFIPEQHRPTQRQFAAIGRVAVTWAEVEWGMENILTLLALAPSLLGHVLTDKLGPDNRIGAIKSLIHVHRTKYANELVDAGVLSAISDLLPVIRKMKDDRNYIVHSVWSRGTDTHLSRFDITAAARSGQDFSVGPLEDVSDIEGFADEVRKLADRLWQLSHQIPRIDGALLDRYSHKSNRVAGALMINQRGNPSVDHTGSYRSSYAVPNIDQFSVRL